MESRSLPCVRASAPVSPWYLKRNPPMSRDTKGNVRKRRNLPWRREVACPAPQYFVLDLRCGAFEMDRAISRQPLINTKYKRRKNQQMRGVVRFGSAFYAFLACTKEGLPDTGGWFPWYFCLLSISYPSVVVIRPSSWYLFLLSSSFCRLLFCRPKFPL